MAYLPCYVQSSSVVSDEKKVFDAHVNDFRPKQPGHDIDVYLAPFIDDLKDLYENGVEAYDGLRKKSLT